jgi:hypothetical protein
VGVICLFVFVHHPKHTGQIWGVGCKNAFHALLLYFVIRLTIINYKITGILGQALTYAAHGNIAGGMRRENDGLG